jgi:Swt1-like HEPN
MIDDQRLALFVMLGQSASAAIAKAPELVAPESLRLSDKYELATMMPEAVRRSTEAAESYRLFFVFEGYLREFVAGVLIGKDAENWWDSVPQDVKDEVAKMEQNEEAKSWMALGSRDKTALMTYPQLLRVIDHCWKSHFEDLLRDKTLVQQARLIAHLRNTICHMSTISAEELERVRQTMRDWFRRIPP